MASQDTLHLTIRSREGIMYQGEVYSVSSENDDGKFDILPQHSNFITLMQGVLIVRNTNGQIQNIQTGSNGILRVRDNKVEILLGVKSPTVSNLR